MKTDDLLRNAEEAALRDSQNLNQLAQMPPNDLYAALAHRTIAVANQVAPPQAQDNDDNLRAVSVPLIMSFGTPLDTESLTRDAIAVELGKRIFWRWSQTLHDFACEPSKADADLARRLLDSVTGRGNGTAIVAAVLAGYFAVNAGVAAVVAALITKLIWAPAADEVCKAWTEQLRKGQS